MFYSLIALTAAFSGAVLIAMLLREPCRKLAGSKLAYWIWLLVPLALVAILAPAVPHLASPAPPAAILMVGQPALSAAASDPPSAKVMHGLADTLRDLAPWLLAVWGLGLVIFLGCTALLQRRFMLQLGRLVPDPSRRNVFYSHKVGVSPSVVGLLPSRIILPADFSALYEPNEQHLILAHEGTHVRERHPLAGAAALVFLAIQWFNPLAYLALALFRIDQELACDAAVVAAHPDERATYAKAMLKACAESGIGPPLGYCWSGALALPMIYRIGLLRDKPPTPGRRAVAIFLLALGATGSAVIAYGIAPHAEVSLRLFSPTAETLADANPTVIAPTVNTDRSGGAIGAAPASTAATSSSNKGAFAKASVATDAPPRFDTSTADGRARQRAYDALADARARGENVPVPVAYQDVQDGAPVTRLAISTKPGVDMQAVFEALRAAEQGAKDSDKQRE